MKDVDYIIVGSGLAGVVMAHTLQKHQCSFRIISQPERSRCSLVAAGIYNPVVFFRITKSYMVDLVLPYAIRFYKDSELSLKGKFLTSKTVGRIFSSEEERKLWNKRREEGVGHYLGDIVNAKPEEKINAPHGLGLIEQTGHLDCSSFIQVSLGHFKDSCFEEHFNQNELRFENDRVLYKNISASSLIFCEGYKGMQNQYFDKVLFKPVKGEILTIEFDEPLPHGLKDLILSKKCYLMPLADNRYKVGATYNWEDLTEDITDVAKKELANSVKEITSIPFRIIDQQAGIRPAVADRRPVIGKHAQFESLAIFNGLGTKGVMLAPYFAEALFQLLQNNKPVPGEVNVKRFDP